MGDTKTLLVVAHQPSANTGALVAATLDGARNGLFENVRTRYLPPLEAASEDVLAADAIILGTTENFGYMSGALKDFFDRIYYPCLDKTDALPYALYIRAGHDGTGTRRAVEKICNGLRWKPVQPPLLLRGDYRRDFVAACRSLGETVAASLDAGII